MINQILTYIAIFNWIIGMTLIFFSSFGLKIEPNKIRRKGWRKYRRGYSTKELKLLLKSTTHSDDIRKIENQILYRRLYPMFLFSSILIILIINL